VDEAYVIEPSELKAYDAIAYMPSVAERLDTDSISLFRDALQANGLLARLSGAGPFTVFAPVNSSFANAGDAVAPSPASRERLAAHIVPGRYLKIDLFDVQTLRTIDGRDLPVEIRNAKPVVGSARILFGDQQARNGVVHLVYPAVDM